MPRGTALSVVRSMLKAEVGDSAQSNPTRDTEYNARLSNEQIRLADEFPWSFLEQRWDVAVAAGQRFVTFPTVVSDGPGAAPTIAMNMNREIRADVFWSNKYFPLMYGIGADEYNQLNPDLREYSDPIRKWRNASNVDDATPNQFEVWPVPSEAETIRFTATRVLLPLVNNTDTFDLDDLVIVYFVASTILAREKQAEAQIMAQKAQRRLQFLKQQDKQSDKVRCLGQGGGKQEFDRDRRLVAIAGNRTP